MPRLFYHVMQDNLGNLLFDVSGTMRIAGTGTLATIYGDEGLSVILPNPMTNHPSFGSFRCFLNVGDYDFYMAKPGYTFETLTGVQGHGTMAEQNATAVAITGGTAILELLGVGGAGADPAYPLNNAGPSRLVGPITAQNATFGGDVTGETAIFARVGLGGAGGDPAFPLNNTGPSRLVGHITAQTATFGGDLTGGTAILARLGLGGAGGDPAFPLNNSAPSRLVGHITAQTANFAGNVTLQTFVGIGPAGVMGGQLTVSFPKTTGHGLFLKPTDSDAGSGYSVVFLNVASAIIGSIGTTDTATSYNTTSDARLKTDVHPLTGALDVLRALNPVRYRWKADKSPGVGLLAQEVQAVIPTGVITGARDALDDQGQIVPQMIDYSKLVPHLIAAVKELTQQVDLLQAQLAEAGA